MRALPTAAGRIAILAACAVSASAPAQQPAPGWSDVVRQLEDPELSADARRGLLERFLAARPTGEQHTDDVLSARLMLAGEWLAAFDAARARAQFEAVVENAPPRAVDARGRALYGAAQAAELAGDARRATDHYERIGRELGGTRYADFARVALHRLARPASQRPVPGRPAPEFGPALDAGGNARRLADLRGRPALLVFVDPTDDEALDRVRRQVRTAIDAGVPAGGVVLFSTTANGDAVLRLARDPELKAPVLPAPSGFVSPVFLLYEVRAVPSMLLVGPDGTVLGRDLPARRLRAVLDGLRGG